MFERDEGRDAHRREHAQCAARAGRRPRVPEPVLRHLVRRKLHERDSHVALRPPMPDARAQEPQDQALEEWRVARRECREREHGEPHVSRTRCNRSPRSGSREPLGLNTTTKISTASKIVPAYDTAATIVARVLDASGTALPHKLLSVEVSRDKLTWSAPVTMSAVSGKAGSYSARVKSISGKRTYVRVRFVGDDFNTTSRGDAVMLPKVYLTSVSIAASRTRTTTVSGLHQARASRRGHLGDAAQGRQEVGHSAHLSQDEHRREVEHARHVHRRNVETEGARDGRRESLRKRWGVPDSVRLLIA